MNYKTRHQAPRGLELLKTG